MPSTGPRSSADACRNARRWQHGRGAVGCTTFKPPDITYDDEPPAVLRPSRPKLYGNRRGAEAVAATWPAQANSGGKATATEPRDPGSASIRPTPPRASSRPAAATSMRCRSIRLSRARSISSMRRQARSPTLRCRKASSSPGRVRSPPVIRCGGSSATPRAGQGRQRIHILVKPTRPDLVTNLVINTDRRTYHLELRSTEKTYMASVSWTYPQDQLAGAPAAERNGRGSDAHCHCARSQQSAFPLYDRRR